MSRIILVTGGARSGKSLVAEELTERFGAPLGYLATAQAGDSEMSERIKLHQERRGDNWQTMEEPLDLCGVIGGHDGHFNAVLVDCLILWLSNLLLHHNAPAPVLAEVRRLTSLFPKLNTSLVVVTGEVGMGIVPENSLARSYRDLAGEANQMIAAVADEVYLTVCGIPTKIKG